MGARNVDPVLSYQFGIEFAYDPFGLIPFFTMPLTGYFTEVSGLAVEWETIEYKTTNIIGLPRSNFVRGRPRYSPITLKRGVTSGMSFWMWHMLIALGAKPMFKPYVMITMYDRSYNAIVQWSVEEAWPIKVTGPDIRSDSSEVAIEELTLQHSGVTRMPTDPVENALMVGLQLLLP
jgi:phage tail-like protein